MTEEIHYFAFNIEGWSAHENLGDCIDRQLCANGGCYAVMKVQAPIKATYSISSFLPQRYYDTSAFNPGEQVYFTPVLAPHSEVSEDFRPQCKDTTGWTVEKWREYANLTMLLEEAKQAKAQQDAALESLLEQARNYKKPSTLEKLKAPVVAEIKAPFLTSKNGLPCAWEDILPHMPQGIVCYATNEAEWLHVSPDIAIITKYRPDYSTGRYMCIDGSTYNYAEPALPHECTLNFVASVPEPGAEEYFGTVKDGEDPLLADNDNDYISKF